jgi:hypothetical protein
MSENENKTDDKKTEEDEWDSKTWKTKESRDYCMDMLTTPEFQAFYENYYYTEKDNPFKYSKGAFANSWARHCLGLELGAREPMTHQDSAQDATKLSAGKWSKDTKQWVTDTPLQPRSIQDSEKPKLTAGRFNKDSQQWENEKTIEKDSASGLTAGKWDKEKKRWIR